MHTQTPVQAIRHAWATIKIEAQEAIILTTGERACSDAEIALIEPGIRLLELSAAYREAHATLTMTLVRADLMDSFTAFMRLEAAKQALLLAALDPTP